MSNVSSMNEKILSFVNGLELKYLVQEEKKQKRNPNGEEITEVEPSFCLVDMKYREKTPWIAGKKDDKQISFNIHNDKYVVFFRKGTNTLYMVKPKENDSDELYKTFEFKGKKIKDIKLQLNTDIFVITLLDDYEEVEVLFNMASFEIVSKKTFKSLDREENLGSTKRAYVAVNDTADGVETERGIVDIVTGEVEKVQIEKEPNAHSIIIPIQNENKKGFCRYDVESNTVISDCFEYIGERVESGVSKEKSEYKSVANFFVDKIIVRGIVVTIIGIVNEYGQIAPRVFNATSKEIIKVPLKKENGIDIVDREILSETLSTRRRSIIDDNVEEIIRKANRDFLTRGMPKEQVQGKETLIGKEKQLVEARIDAGDYQLTYLLEYNEAGNIVSAQLKPITIEQNFKPEIMRIGKKTIEKPRPMYYDLFGDFATLEDIQQMSTDYYGNSNDGFVVANLNIKMCPYFNRQRQLRGCKLNITSSVMECMDKSKGIPYDLLIDLASLDMERIKKYVNIGLIDPKGKLGRKGMEQVSRKIIAPRNNK